MLLPPFEEYVLDGDGYTAATTFILEASRCAELKREREREREREMREGEKMRGGSRILDLNHTSRDVHHSHTINDLNRSFTLQLCGLCGLPVAAGICP